MLGAFYSVASFGVVIVLVVCLTRTIGIDVTPQWLGLWNNSVARENYAGEKWRLRLRWLGWRLLGGLGFPALMIVCNGVAEEFFGSTGHSDSEASALVGSAGPAALLGYAALAVIGAPLVEETLARGFIYGFIRRWIGGLAASRYVAAGAVPSAMIFSVGHGYSFSALLVAAFLGGIVLAVIYEVTGSLWPAILGRASYNGIGLLLAISQEPLIKGLEALAAAL